MRSLAAVGRHCLHGCAVATPRRSLSFRKGLDEERGSETAGGSERVIYGTDPSSTSGQNEPGYKAKLQGGDRPYDPSVKVREEFPIVQLPARTLWSPQYALSPKMVREGDFAEMIEKVKAARHYYQYPSLCAPQIGWNVQMFTLFDGSVYINPENLDAEQWKRDVDAKSAEIARENVRRYRAHLAKTSADSLAVRPVEKPIDYLDQEERHMARLRQEGKTCFAWEPCASCCFLMHYIERPTTLRLKALDAAGEEKVVELDGLKARFALHELDHLNGILFTRRVVDTDHVVPLEGFNCMSDWSDDWPSLEARSTFLYTTFTPPYSFRTESVEDANLLDRKFEDGVYPGCEHDRQLRIQSAAFQTIQRERWRREEDKGGATVKPAEATEEGTATNDAPIS